ncbi:hypothetical protein ACFCYC_36610 [Streptomyces sp. NPDC056402]|uniref:hypothetical protein n=1 Tax=Streptomyces sp. NPDC056402 TaxID=3345810 RepID=UPI0035DCA525
MLTRSRRSRTSTDEVRRATRKRLTGTDAELGEDAEKTAPDRSAGQLRGHLGGEGLAALMQGAGRPQMACQLVGLQWAGVDLAVLLPQLGRMTAGVGWTITGHIARIDAEGTDRWADLSTTTLPAGLVRYVILAFPAWPDMAVAAGTTPPPRLPCRRPLPPHPRPTPESPLPLLWPLPRGARTLPPRAQGSRWGRGPIRGRRLRTQSAPGAR